MKHAPLLQMAQFLAAAPLCGCGIAAASHADTVVVTADRMIHVLSGREKNGLFADEVSEDRRAAV